MPHLLKSSIFMTVSTLLIITLSTCSIGSAQSALSLTTEDIVRLLLENNRDVIVNRLAPISSVYSITSLIRPFQPNFHIIGNVNRAKTPSRSQLTGAPALKSADA